MKLIIVLCLVAVAVAAPPNFLPPSGEVSILKFIIDNIGLGSYRFGFEQSDGQKREEQGVIKNEGKEDELIAVKGSYEWVGPDGIKYTVNYVADEDGYQPTIEQGPGGGAPPAVVASLLG